MLQAPAAEAKITSIIEELSSEPIVSDMSPASIDKVVTLMLPEAIESSSVFM